MFLLPILSSVFESSANIVDKLNLNKQKISGRLFTSLLFLFMGIFSLPLLYFFKPTTISLLPVITIVGIVIASALQNFLFYVALSNKNLSHLEPIRNSEPIITILLAFLIYPSERHSLILLLGVITTLALIYSHLGKNDLKKIEFTFDKYSSLVLFSMLLSSILNIVYKYILGYVSPIFLYAVRAVAVAIILFILFRPKVSTIKPAQLGFFIFSAILYSLSAVIRYYSIGELGISLTIIVLTISPATIYLFSPIFLKEKLSFNRIIGSIIIIMCVLATTFFSLK